MQVSCLAQVDHLYISFCCLLDQNLDGDGMHNDVHVMSIDESDSGDKPKEKRNPTADVKHFFKPAPHVPGSKSGRSRCESCL